MYWKQKNFKTYEAQQNWIAANSSKYRIEVIFVNNGYCVEYKELVKVYDLDGDEDLDILYHYDIQDAQ